MGGCLNAQKDRTRRPDKMQPDYEKIISNLKRKKEQFEKRASKSDKGMCNSIKYIRTLQALTKWEKLAKEAGQS